MSEPSVFDYLVVGGGSAGCVMAARLSENNRYSVALLEAGGESRSERFLVPGATAFNLGKAKYDWGYQTPADPTIQNRQFDWSAGRVLGGGSAINGLVYIRALPWDFDAWQAASGGNTDWSYDAMLPYFQRAEAFQDRSAAYLGHNGPLAVSGVTDPHPLREAFLCAGIQAGYRRSDLNGPSPEGFGSVDSSQRRGRRASTYMSYVHPHRQRRNLTVFTRAEVLRLRVDKNTVRELDCLIKGRQHRFRARREIVLCAGAIGTPALLLRSGIGARDTLRDLNIDIRHALPGVGENLQEHSGTGVAKYVDIPTLNSQMGPLSGLKHLYAYYRHRRGALSSPIVEAMAFVKTDPNLARPDIQLHFLPFGYIIQPHSRSAITAYQPKRDAMMITITLCKPKTRGRVTLDTHHAVRIEHQLFANRNDLDTLVMGAKLADQLYRQPALSQHVVAPCSPEKSLSSDEAWRDYIRARANIAYHFCGSCRMGHDDMAVVDDQLKLRGLAGLRVVDASVMPEITSGNTNATVIALAERSAELVLQS